MRNEPKMIQASYDTVCLETGKPILKGDYFIWYGKGKAYHLESKQAYEYLNWKADQAQGYDY